MKLWILRPRTDLKSGNPWAGYDVMEGLVVRAETEPAAREIAQSFGMEEIADGRTPVWTDAAFSTCLQLDADGPAALIIKDVFRA